MEQQISYRKIKKLLNMAAIYVDYFYQNYHCKKKWTPEKLKSNQLKDYEVMFDDELKVENDKYFVMIDGMDIRTAKPGNNWYQTLTFSTKNNINGVRFLLFGMFPIIYK